MAYEVFALKWLSHEVVTFGLSFIFTEDLFFSLCTLVGANLPDKFDGKPPDIRSDYQGYWNWRTHHRSLSHWFLPYLVIIFAITVYRFCGQFSKSELLVLDFAVYVMVGAILHIVEDSFCGKVPVFSLKSKRGFNLFKVGELFEYIFCLFLLVLACILRWFVFSRF
nr:MAG TPA_asm: putative metal-binding protein [Caudoviricetes sp.]